MKCKCGNETGKPRVNPFPVSYVDIKTKQTMEYLYMGGFNQRGQCWFCAFPRVGVHLVK